MLYRKVKIIGTDVNGRRCPVAEITVGAEWTIDQCRDYIRSIEHKPGHRPWSYVTNNDLIY